MTELEGFKIFWLRLGSDYKYAGTLAYARFCGNQLSLITTSCVEIHEVEDRGLTKVWKTLGSVRGPEEFKFDGCFVDLARSSDDTSIFFSSGGDEIKLSRDPKQCATVQNILNDLQLY